MPSEANHLRLIVGRREPETPGAQPPAKAEVDDALLLAALKAGNASAATALHDRTRPVVQRTVRRLLGARDTDTEDLCQLAFIELVNTIEQFREACPLDAWVSMISARVVYKHIRRRKLERRLFSRTLLQVVPEVGTTARHNSLLRDLVRRVNEHLTRVDDSRAFTFLLHDAYGYDLKEIAQITGVSVSAAQTRLVRGRREVHERIAGDPALASALDDLRDLGDS
ncbi:MAG: RNA polymerase sigma factor [Pseudomonadota bacterium]